MGSGAEGAELVTGQYADRPHLRPILDAVLAALPALGPVTVQARKTCVSLVSPRAMRPGHRLVARVRLTASDGMPICARVRPPNMIWSAESAGAKPQVAEGA